MSLNRYHNSRSSDNVFKLLNEETSYLDILKGNVKAAYKDEIDEDKAVGPYENVRQELLREADEGTEAVDDSKVDEKPEEKEGTPEQQGDAAEEAGEKASEVDKEMGVKEDIDALIENELEEISIAVARQAAGRVAKHTSLAQKGLLRGKGGLSKQAKIAIANKKKAVLMGRV